MDIRFAIESDLPAIVEIYNASIPARLATGDTEPVTVEERRTWFAAHDVDRRPLWVAEQDGAVVGWVALQSFYGRPAYEATAEISVYVSPEHFGRGVGEQLKRRVIEECPRLGVRNVLAFVFGHNEVSLRLCEKLGFERWGLLPGVAELDGELRDLVILGLKV